MSRDEYAIEGGVEGRERLRLLSRVFRDGTMGLLDRVGVERGHYCIDLGCGGGDVTVELARRVGPGGRALGLDRDDVALGIARTEAEAAGLKQPEYRQHDAHEPIGGPAADLVYMRFLLSHVADPARVLENVRAGLRPGGRVAVMDIDFRGHFAWPESAALDRFVDLYTQVVARRGGNANIGPRLPSLLMATGFEDVRMHLVHLADLEGDTKLLTPVTMQLIAGAVADAGLAEPDELRSIIEALYAEARDPTTVMGLPRVVQAWARKPG